MTTTDRITAMRRELVHRQDGKCARCVQPMGDDVHITIIRARSEGGDTSPGNLVATHALCNFEPDLTKFVGRRFGQ